MSKIVIENRNGTMVDFDSAFELMDENIRKDYVIQFIFEDYSEGYLGCDRDGLLYNNFELNRALMFSSIEEAKEFYNHYNWFGPKEIKAKIKVLVFNDVAGGEGILELKK